MALRSLKSGGQRYQIVEQPAPGIFLVILSSYSLEFLSRNLRFRNFEFLSIVRNNDVKTVSFFVAKINCLTIKSKRNFTLFVCCVLCSFIFFQDNLADIINNKYDVIIMMRGIRKYPINIIAIADLNLRTKTTTGIISANHRQIRIFITVAM